MNMKRFLTLILVVVMTAAHVYAQSETKKDLIYKIDNEVVEAIILEVSSAEVKYKEWNNPDGPTFVLKASEIGKIQLSNGTVKTYNTLVQADPQSTAVAPAPVSVTTTAAMAAAPAPAPTPSATSATTATAQSGQTAQASNKQKSNTAKLPLGFQLNIDLAGNLTRIGGAYWYDPMGVRCYVDPYMYGGLSLSMGAGVRMGKFLYVGAAVDIQGNWGNSNYKADNGNKNIACSISQWTLPIYANARVYAPTHSTCYPYYELGIGGYVGLTDERSADWSSDNYGKVTISSTPKGGFFLNTGFGLEFRYLTIGVGYKLFTNADYRQNHGYLKVGVSIGRPNKIK